VSNGNDQINPILDAMLESRSADGVALFERMTEPTPKDQCWAGQCLVILDRAQEGLLLLSQAAAQGFDDALPFVAGAYNVLGEVELMHSTLNGIDLARLSPFAKACAVRDRGLLEYIEDRMPQALVAFEQAWTLANADPVGRRAIRWFDMPLGLLHAELGRDQRALVYLDRAIKGNSTAHLLGLRALSLTYLGRLEEAAADLKLARQDHLSPALPSATFERISGVFNMVRGSYNDAVQHLLEAVALARAQGNQQTEFFACLNLATLATVDESFSLARGYIARSRGLAETVSMHAHLALRHGSLLVRAGEVTAGLESLRLALKGLQSLGVEREVGIAHLHLAEGLFRDGQDAEAFAQLALAVDARHALGHGTMLAAELRGLPLVFEHVSLCKHGDYVFVLLEDWRALERNGPSEVVLTTLGGYDLRFKGKPIRLNAGLTRTVEVLAFLLDRGEVSIDQIQLSVFADHYPEQAKSYIHLVRQLVAKAIPGLSVPYEQTSKTYKLMTHGVRVTWDALEVQKALKIGGELGVRKALALYTGPFLPRSEGQWAEELRWDLEWSVVRSGLLAVEELFRQERYKVCIELAERLIEINPLEAGISVLMVQAVKELDGVLAARSMLEQVTARFRSSIGEVPEAIEQLRSSAWLSAN
jgi:tetratricopeptide (TPR) repeat protein